MKFPIKKTILLIFKRNISAMKCIIFFIFRLNNSNNNFGSSDLNFDLQFIVKNSFKSSFNDFFEF